MVSFIAAALLGTVSSTQGCWEGGYRFCFVSDKLSLIYITVKEKRLSLTFALGPKLKKGNKGHVAWHRLIPAVSREEADASALLFCYAVPQQSL